MDIKLNNRYTLIEKIGGGGMADVYRAKDEKLERYVAIKVLKEQFADDEEFVKGFRRESYSIAKLNHPNIVSIYDVGVDEINSIKKYYIVMELIEGHNLKDEIRAKGKLNVSESINLITSIARGLYNAHQKGIIHRDVKPQNILLQANSEPKVTDFGIAQGVSKTTMTTNNDILGSVHYFSPEQASGKRTDERSDIYSLGIVFYEMLTGQLPFDGETPVGVALKHIQEQMTKPSSINPSVPKEIDSIILKMTMKDPDDRYSSIKEFLKDLQRLSLNNQTNEYDTLILPKEQIQNHNKETSTPKERVTRSKAESTDKKTSDKKGKGSNKFKSILTILFAVILAGVVATAAFYFGVTNLFGSKSKADIEVPDLLGVNIEEARDILEDLNLEIEITDARINPDFDPEYIIDQDPVAGTKVKEGYTVKVVINSGETLVEVSNYIGLDYEYVVSIIEDSGLVLGPTEYEEVEDDRVGEIIKQDLRAGTRVEKNSIISFVVGKEVEIETTTVPQLVGESIDDAESILKSSNLKLGSVTRAESDRFLEGTVMAQSIDSGEEVEVETKIDLTIVVAPEVVEEPVPDPQEKDDNEEEIRSMELSLNLQGGSDQEVELRIDRVQDGVKTEMYREMRPANSGRIIVDVYGKKGAVYEMFVDGDSKGIVEQW